MVTGWPLQKLIMQSSLYLDDLQQIPITSNITSQPFTGHRALLAFLAPSLAMYPIPRGVVQLFEMTCESQMCHSYSIAKPPSCPKMELKLIVGLVKSVGWLDGWTFQTVRVFSLVTYVIWIVSPFSWNSGFFVQMGCTETVFPGCIFPGSSGLFLPLPHLTDMRFSFKIQLTVTLKRLLWFSLPWTRSSCTILYC